MTPKTKTQTRTALTLIELIVSIFLGMLIFGLLLRAFFHFRNQSETPLSSMSMEQTTISLMRHLQRDISETNLQSIRTLPNKSGAVMISGRDSSDNLSLTPLGVLQWRKWIYFRVQTITSSVPLPASIQVDGAAVTPTMGELNYDEDNSGITAEAGNPPGLTPPAPVAGRHRPLCRNFLVNNAANDMGCHIYFPDSAGNPQDFTDTQRGEPVCVAMKLLEISPRTGKPTVRKIFMQIKPKN